MFKKRDILEHIRTSLNSSELVLVSDYQNYARHVCLGGNKVHLVPIQQGTIQDEDRLIVIKYFQCSECGKTIVVDDFM